MPLSDAAPWHRRSFDAFLDEGLPALLAGRLPLAACRAEPAGDHACRVRVTLAGPDGDVALDFPRLPRPDADGVFHLGDGPRVVVPTASSVDLAAADIACVGEQLAAFIADRLGEAPKDLPWDDALARSWLPLDAWFDEFLRAAPSSVPLGEWRADRLEHRNWLARAAQLRRLLVPTSDGLIHPSHDGRICPYETPEGPRIGRVAHLAVGARIDGRRIQVADPSPAARLGMTASMVPCIEHDDANRTLMGCNMMRQWMQLPHPEPALVRTGNEPDATDFWCGRNLLTAFTSLGGDTFEDAIVLSRSAAQRMAADRPLCIGDKLSNRHGTKGVVGRILPDHRMPHLDDGTPVELVFSFIGLHTRLNFGQVREALLGRIARAEGKPVLAPVFESPHADALRDRLRHAGLPESGMEVLAAGKGGPKLPRPTTVGWVYWGLTHHLAQDKLRVWTGPDGGQPQADAEACAMRDAGAFAVLADQFNLRSARRKGAGHLAARVADGAVELPGPPTPAFAGLARRLADAGIHAHLDAETLRFRFADPDEPALRLARPVPHPWLESRPLAAVGARPELPEFEALDEANRRLERLVADGTPGSLADRAARRLQDAAADYLGALVAPDHLRFDDRVLFGGRAVIAPGAELRWDQVGLADDLAWGLFTPLLARDLPADDVRSRTDRAARALDGLMARHWVLFNRAPTLMPSGVLAFRPVRIPDPVIRLHPLACALLNADFDGDQAAVFLPLAEAAQREAGEKLSLAGHLRRDPRLARWVRMWMEMLWGLADLGRRPEGLEEIARLAGEPVAAPDGIVTRDTLADALRRRLEADGPEAMLDAAEALMRRGFDVARASGASLSPFAGASVPRPPAPREETPDAWFAYEERCAERLAARRDFDDPDVGPQILAVLSGARGNLKQLVVGLLGRAVVGADGRLAVEARGLIEGLSPRVTFATVVGARKGLAEVCLQLTRADYGAEPPAAPKGWSVLARAMRAAHPGVVFAHAADAAETDPLADRDVRLFVGLPV